MVFGEVVTEARCYHMEGFMQRWHVRNVLPGVLNVPESLVLTRMCILFVCLGQLDAVVVYVTRKRDNCLKRA